MNAHHRLLSVIVCPILASIGLIGVSIIAAPCLAQTPAWPIFDEPVSYPLGNNPVLLTIADANQDGTLDVITSDTAADMVVLFRGVGDGAFEPPVALGQIDSPRINAIGDLNGDGVVDLATAYQGVNPGEPFPTGGLAIFMGLGGGAFAPAVTYATGFQSREIQLGDLDNDGDLDAVVVNVLSADVSIMHNNGDGTFVNVANHFAGGFPGALNLGDIDGDGFLDLVVGAGFASGVRVFYNNGDGLIKPRSVFISLGDSSFDPELVDLDNDGDLDLATTTADVPVVVLNLFENINGIFTFRSSVPCSTAGYIDAGDLDGDGLVDLVVANAIRNTITVLRSTAPFSVETLGTLDLNPLMDLTMATGNAELADFDGDGDLDMAAPRGGNSDDLLVYMNIFTQPLVADLTGDGVVNGVDLAYMLVNWGADKGSDADLTGDGVVNGADLAALLVQWGRVGQ